MAIHRFREGSIYTTGVAFKTKIFFYRMWYGIPCLQNYYSILNPISLPFHNIILIRRALKLYPSTQTPNHQVWILFWINGHFTCEQTSLSAVPRLPSEGFSWNCIPGRHRESFGDFVGLVAIGPKWKALYLGVQSTFSENSKTIPAVDAEYSRECSLFRSKNIT
jgi:hypothetical protein